MKDGHLGNKVVLTPDGWLEIAPGKRGLISRVVALVKSLYQAIQFRLNLHRYEISENWIRCLYAALIELDLPDFESFAEYELMAFGSTVHVRIPRFSYEFTINENSLGQIYIHERAGLGEDWKLAYRSGRYLASVRFADFMAGLESVLDEMAEELRGKQ